jgi:hypothetical protein
MKRPREGLWWFFAFVLNTALVLGAIAFLEMPPNYQVWLGVYLLLSNGLFAYYRDKPKKGGK